MVACMCAGADRQPELLQHIFTCLSSLCRHLVKHLTADLPGILRLSTQLRYAAAEYVRRLAAQSVGYLFRHASFKAVRAGVRTVFAGKADKYYSPAGSDYQ
jgi:U3 small nucleolar RNA-associated protein 20